MRNSESVSKSETKRWYPYTVLLSAGAIALTSCSKSESVPLSDTRQSISEGIPSVQPPASSPERTELIFDDLDGGSSIIRVYAGTQESEADKSVTGTYANADVIPAECKEKGRTIHSDTSVGETDRTSDDWIRITGTPGQTQFATAVYVKNPEELLAQLPNC